MVSAQLEDALRQVDLDRSNIRFDAPLVQQALSGDATRYLSNIQTSPPQQIPLDLANAVKYFLRGVTSGSIRSRSPHYIIEALDLYGYALRKHVSAFTPDEIAAISHREATLLLDSFKKMLLSVAALQNYWTNNPFLSAEYPSEQYDFQLQALLASFLRIVFLQLSTREDMRAIISYPAVQVGKRDSNKIENVAALLEQLVDGISMAQVAELCARYKARDSDPDPEIANKFSTFCKAVVTSNGLVAFIYIIDDRYIAVRYPTLEAAAASALKDLTTPLAKKNVLAHKLGVDRSDNVHATSIGCIVPNLNKFEETLKIRNLQATNEVLEKAAEERTATMLATIVREVVTTLPQKLTRLVSLQSALGNLSSALAELLKNPDQLNMSAGQRVLRSGDRIFRPLDRLLTGPYTYLITPQIDLIRTARANLLHALQSAERLDNCAQALLACRGILEELFGTSGLKGVFHPAEVPLFAHLSAVYAHLSSQAEPNSEKELANLQALKKVCDEAQLQCEQMISAAGSVKTNLEFWQKAAALHTNNSVWQRLGAQAAAQCNLKPIPHNHLRLVDNKKYGVAPHYLRLTLDDTDDHTWDLLFAFIVRGIWSGQLFWDGRSNCASIDEQIMNTFPVYSAQRPFPVFYSDAILQRPDYFLGCPRDGERPHKEVVYLYPPGSFQPRAVLIRTLANVRVHNCSARHTTIYDDFSTSQ